MKYYVMLIQHFVNSTPTAQSLFEYTTKNSALAAYYYNLSSSVSNDNIEKVYCEILNEYGDILDRKFLQVAPIPDDEEETEG